VQVTPTSLAAPLVRTNGTWHQARRWKIREITERTLTGDDAETALLSCLREIAEVTSGSPERAGMIRLIVAEMPHFPEAVQLWRQRGISPLFEDWLKRLAGSGVLTIDDPAEAAGHLSALTLGQINNRSVMGTVPLSDAETEAILSSGVAVFLRAYG
jgi:hypothetical protein